MRLLRQVGEHCELMNEFVYGDEQWLQLRYVEPAGGWTAVVRSLWEGYL